MITLLLGLSTASALDPQAERAQAELGMEPALAQDIRKGLELMFERRYENTREHFEAVEANHEGGTGLAAVADLLVWQALMMENFDYRFSKQYWTSSKTARTALEGALDDPKNNAWEHFLLAGVTGVEAIHKMRTARYIPALQNAFEAIDHVEQTRAVAPNFTDLKLADGMYNYWRTAVTQSVSVLPDFGDRKAEGIAQMQAVEKDGLFLAKPATLSMAFTWLEEKDKDKALASCLSLRPNYPDNVINNMVLGSIYVSKSDNKTAIGLFDEILEDSPRNRRARYWKGIGLQRDGKLTAALAEYQAYLAFEYMEKEQRAQAHYRVGQVKYSQKLYDEAEAAWKTAIKVGGGHKRAKERLDQLKTDRKSGTYRK